MWQWTGPSLSFKKICRLVHFGLIIANIVVAVSNFRSTSRGISKWKQFAWFLCVALWVWFCILRHRHVDDVDGMCNRDEYDDPVQNINLLLGRFDPFASIDFLPDSLVVGGLRVTKDDVFFYRFLDPSGWKTVPFCLNFYRFPPDTGNHITYWTTNSFFPFHEVYQFSDKEILHPYRNDTSHRNLRVTFVDVFNDSIALSRIMTDCFLISSILETGPRNLHEANLN